MEGIFRESGRVKAGYEIHIEEHLGVSNRNLEEVGLEAAKALFLEYQVVSGADKLGGTAEFYLFVP